MPGAPRSSAATVARGGVLDVDEGEGAGALADDRQPALQHFLGLLSRRGRSRCRGRRTSRSGGPGPRSPRPRAPGARARRPPRRRAELARRIGEQRRLLVLDPVALGRVEEGDALGDEPPRAGRRAPPRSGCGCPRCASGWSPPGSRSSGCSAAAARSARGRRPRAPPRPPPPSAAASKTSQTTAFAPAARISSARSSRRVIPVTSCPAATSCRTSGLPIAPAGSGDEDLHPRS